MKRILILLLFIIIGELIFLGILAYNDDYWVERNLWRVEQGYQKLTIDPEHTPQISFDRVASELKLFLESYPNRKTTPIAYLLLAKVFVLNKQFDEARLNLEAMANKYSDQPDLALKALIELGRTYNLQNDFDNVLMIHERILKEYPLTDIGLQAPLGLYQVYMLQKNPEKANEALLTAILYYQKLIKENQGSVVEMRVLSMLGKAFALQGQWERAANIYGESLIKFANNDFFNQEEAEKVIRSLNTIALARLNNYDLPMKYYQEFVNKYPQHHLKGIFERLITSLKSIQMKDVAKSQETPT